MDRKRNEEIAAFDNSEVMANFVKIAYDSGIISMDKDETELTPLEPYDKDTITEKYNVHPGPDKDGRDLIDQAHPDTAKIIDSYLEGGGIVENEQQAQDIDISVADKKPYYNDIHHKNISAATKDLMYQLVLVADEMDIREQNDIAKFADTMIAGINKSAGVVKKKLNKKAGSSSIFKNLGFLKWLAAAAGIGIATTIAGREIESGEAASVESAVDKFIKNLIVIKQGKEKNGTLELNANELGTLISKLEKAKSKYLLARDAFIDKSKEFADLVDVENKKDQIEGALSDVKEMYEFLVKSLHEIKNTYTRGIFTKESIKNTLEAMSKVQPEENEDYNTWDNLFNNARRTLELLSSEKKDTENALSLLDRSIDEELKIKKNNLDYFVKLAQEAQQKPELEPTVEKPKDEAIEE